MDGLDAESYWSMERHAKEKDTIEDKDYTNRQSLIKQ